MALVFFILVIIVCVVLSFFVLVQNPKGGGLSGTFGGINNQFMGVKQTTDVLEKGTWIFASVLGALCIVSVLFFGSATTKTNNNDLLNGLPTTPSSGQQTAPAQTPAPTQQTPAKP